MNYNSKMSKLRGTDILEHSEFQRDIVLFLKNKRHFEGEPKLLEDKKIKDQDEEFFMEFNAEKKGPLPVNSTTGATLNLQGDLSL